MINLKKWKQILNSGECFTKHHLWTSFRNFDLLGIVVEGLVGVITVGHDHETILHMGICSTLGASVGADPSLATVPNGAVETIGVAIDYKKFLSHLRRDEHGWK